MVADDRLTENDRDPVASDQCLASGDRNLAARDRGLGLERRSASRLQTIALRLLRVVLLFLTASLVLYVLVSFLPGDVTTKLLNGAKADPAALAALREKLGLDQPVVVQYLHWLGGLLSGDLGHTLLSDQPVARILHLPFLATVILAAVVLALILLVTVPLSIIAGLRGRDARPFARLLDRGVSGISLVIASVPEFVIGMALLAILAQALKLLPVLSLPDPGQSVLTKPTVLILPALALWLVASAALFRRIKALTASYAEQTFIRDARLAGLSPARILFVHLLPTLAPGLAQLLVRCVPYLLGGTVVVETVCTYPGLGYTFVGAVTAREAPVVMAIGSFLILVTAIAYALTDLTGVQQPRSSD